MNVYDAQIINPYKQYTFIFVNVWELREYILKYPFILGCSQLFVKLVHLWQKNTSSLEVIPFGTYFCEFSRRKTKIKRTINLPVLFYVCRTWSLILREEHKLRDFENKVLGKTFGPKRDVVTGEWRRLHNEELNDLDCSQYIMQVRQVRRMRRTDGLPCGTYGRQ